MKIMLWFQKIKKLTPGKNRIRIEMWVYTLHPVYVLVPQTNFVQKKIKTQALLLFLSPRAKPQSPAISFPL